MNFRLTKKKVIWSIVIIVAWWILLNIFGIISRTNLACDCFTIGDCSINSIYLYLIPFIEPCPPCCPGLSEVLILWLIVLIPGILVYIIWSFAQKKKEKKEIKGNKSQLIS